MNSQSINHQANVRRLLAYIVDLEVEVDRLRQHSRSIHEQMRAALEMLRGQPANGTAGTLGPAPMESLLELLSDLQDLPGYHPAEDRVVSVEVRPLIEKIFRYHLRLAEVKNIALNLQLAEGKINWFPGRLRHILDNLLSNTLKFRDPHKTDTRITLEIQADPQWYTLILSDNGLGMSKEELNRVTDPHLRAQLSEEGLGVGLVIVKRLVDQSGGAMAIESRESEGTTVKVVLPRYDLDDFLA